MAYSQPSEKWPCRNPRMTSYINRHDSFKDSWCLISDERMAAAGLYAQYTRSSMDRASCHSCSFTHSDWSEKNDPEEMHLKYVKDNQIKCEWAAKHYRKLDNQPKPSRCRRCYQNFPSRTKFRTHWKDGCQGKTGSHMKDLLPVLETGE